MDMDIAARLTKDAALAAKYLSTREARFLVDYYYICQEDRKRSMNQERALAEEREPNLVLSWLTDQSLLLEKNIKRALLKYAEAHPVGRWMMSNYGIGPVIAAGFLAYVDIKKAPTVGHIWRYAGLDPTVKWEKGKLRPWNDKLKTLTWKVGQSFMKFSNREDCHYGHVYRARKLYETARNDSGGNAARAAELLPRFSKATEAYGHLLMGKLSPAHIDAQARRYAVKLFIAHMHEVWYTNEFGGPPPLPYPIAILNHAHYIKPFVEFKTLEKEVAA